MRCECGICLGAVNSEGLRIDLWNLYLSGPDYRSSGLWINDCVRHDAMEYLVCYMVHHISLSATHTKFALVPPSGRDVLVFPSTAFDNSRFGCMQRMQ